ELDDVEKQLKVRLPRSYREFMKRFGPGEFQGWARLHLVTPSVKSHFTVTEDTKACREFMPGSARENRTKRWLERVVYFASSAGGDKYVWDPNDVTSSQPHECRFYLLWRGSEERPQRAGNSFWEFVQCVEADVRSWREENPEDEPITGIT